MAAMTTTTTDTTIASRIDELTDAALPDLIAIRRDLHAHPELGYQEERTAGVIQRELESIRVPFAGGLAGGTGTLAHLDGDAQSATGLRADIDALPIEEETGVPYASTHPGKMHACGHDGHTTMLLGAARVLKQLHDDGGLPRPVTFCFQPAEEGGAGGKRMVEDGCLDGSVIGKPVDIMFGIHGWPLLSVGEIGSRPGPLLAAADMFRIEVRGVGGHAAAPHLAHDPMPCAAAIVQAFQTIPSRGTDPNDACVVSVTKMHGGTAHNIIPEMVEIGGTVRTLTRETKAMAVERLHRMAETVAAAYGCTATIDYHHGYPVTRNDPAAWSVARAVAVDQFGEGDVIDLETPSMGGEDFSYYGEVVPACFAFLGTRPSDAPVGTVPNLHQATFDFNDDALRHGIGFFCRLAMRAEG